MARGPDIPPSPRRARPRAGFTLAELLVAVSVAAIVGGAALAIVPRAFALLGNARSRVQPAAEALAFDDSFARDFASLVPALGFDGTPARCAFWTVRQTGPGERDLRHVCYARDPAGVVLTEASPREYMAVAGTNALCSAPLPRDTWEASRLARVRFLLPPAPFAYGGTNMTEAADLPEWSCPTGAPARVVRTLEPRRGDAFPRLYHRRTRP